MTHKPMTKDEVLAVLDAAIMRNGHRGDNPGELAMQQKARDTIAGWNVSPSADVVLPSKKHAYRQPWQPYAAFREEQRYCEGWNDAISQLAQQGGESKDD